MQALRAKIMISVRHNTSCSQEMVNAEPSAKSCRKDMQRAAPITPEDALQEAADIVAMAFGGPSENAICEKAAFELKCSENRVRSVLKKHTHDPSWVMVRQAIDVLITKTDDPLKLPALARFMAKLAKANAE